MLLAAAAVVAAVPAAADTVVVTAARMLDVEKGAIVQRPTITVTDGRITAIGGTAPADAKRIDLGDVTLVPGLIDMHVHLDSTPLYGGYTGLQFTDNFWAVQGVGNAAAMLRAGFTTDNGNIIIDVHDLSISEPIALETRINQIPGVVTNGLFAARPADTLLIATDTGVDTLAPSP